MHFVAWWDTGKVKAQDRKITKKKRDCRRIRRTKIKNKNQYELWRLKGYEGYRGRGRERQRQG